MRWSPETSPCPYLVVKETEKSKETERNYSGAEENQHMVSWRKAVPTGGMATVANTAK